MKVDPSLWEELDIELRALGPGQPGRLENDSLLYSEIWEGTEADEDDGALHTDDTQKQAEFPENVAREALRLYCAEHGIEPAAPVDMDVDMNEAEDEAGGSMNEVEHEAGDSMNEMEHEAGGSMDEVEDELWDRTTEEEDESEGSKNEADDESGDSTTEEEEDSGEGTTEEEDESGGSKNEAEDESGDSTTEEEDESGGNKNDVKYGSSANKAKQDKPGCSKRKPSIRLRDRKRAASQEELSSEADDDEGENRDGVKHPLQSVQDRYVLESDEWNSDEDSSVVMLYEEDVKPNKAMISGSQQIRFPPIDNPLSNDMKIRLRERTLTGRKVAPVVILD